MLGPWETLGSEGERGCCTRPRSCHRATRHPLGEVGSFLLQGRRGRPREVSTLPKVTQLSSQSQDLYSGQVDSRPTLLPVNPFLNYIFKKDSHNMVFKRFIWKKKKKIHLRKKLGLPLPRDQDGLNLSSLLVFPPRSENRWGGSGGKERGWAPAAPGGPPGARPPGVEWGGERRPPQPQACRPK